MPASCRSLAAPAAILLLTTIALKASAQPAAPAVQPAEQPPGPGLMVCEPVGSAAADLPLGKACARWLQLVVGGQPELGLTPLWSSVDRVRHELKLADLRLDLPDAARLGERLGVTHVATAALQGDAQRMTLTFRLWQLPARKPVGEPLSVAGSAETVHAGLPSLAAALARRLGVTRPRLPAQADSLANLRTLGSFPRTPGVALVARIEELKRVAHPSVIVQDLAPPLGTFAMLLFSGAARNDRWIAQSGSALAEHLPDNALVLAEYAELARTHHSDPMKLPRAEMTALLHQYPRNALLLMAASSVERYDSHFQAARRFVERATRAAPHSADTWLRLAFTLTDQATTIRTAHLDELLTADERARIARLLQEEEKAVREALRLDPDYALAWTESARIASAQHNSGRAVSDFRKALDLDPEDYVLYRTGIYLFAYGPSYERKSLVELARRAAKVAGHWGPPDRKGFAYAMHMAGVAKEADAVLRTDEERAAVRSQLAVSGRGRQ